MQVYIEHYDFDGKRYFVVVANGICSRLFTSESDAAHSNFEKLVQRIADGLIAGDPKIMAKSVPDVKDLPAQWSVWNAMTEGRGFLLQRPDKTLVGTVYPDAEQAAEGAKNAVQGKTFG